MVTWKQRIYGFMIIRLALMEGAVFGGSVHGVIFDEDGIVQDIEYQNLTGPWHPDF